MGLGGKEPLLTRKEGLIAGVLIFVAGGFLFWSSELSKSNRFFDLLAKFAFAILVVIVARLVTLVFTYVEKEKEKEKEKQFEVYNRFVKMGMEDLRERLSDHDLRNYLGESQTIKVLKTWFPENREIARGLRQAILKKAVVRLLLCKPSAKILSQRSEGAEQQAEWGAFKVYEAVHHVRSSLAEQPGADVCIGFYDSWPGCPVIWYDKERGTNNPRGILMGFYFRGASSTDWPWITVRAGSELSEILNSQFNDLWPDDGCLDTVELMEEWLADNEHFNLKHLKT
jgi:hypothetical protein